MTYHQKRTNPPTYWHAPALRQLYQALQDALPSCCEQGRQKHAQPKTEQSKHEQPWHGVCDVGHEIGAAVLVLLTHEQAPRLLLTKRSRTLNAHAGEVSFVGGRRDVGDVDVVQTALREAYEEIGLCADNVQIIGYLPCQTAKSGMVVCPVVALIDPKWLDTLRGSACEIERIFLGSLDEFLVPPTQTVFRYDELPAPFVTPAWHIDGEVVWGLTGRIIASLLDIGFGVRHQWYYRLVEHR